MTGEILKGAGFAKNMSSGLSALGSNRKLGSKQKSSYPRGRLPRVDLITRPADVLDSFGLLRVYPHGPPLRDPDGDLRPSDLTDSTAATLPSVDNADYSPYPSRSAFLAGRW